MRRWYSLNFNISLDRNQKPKTWIDIFIIDTIVREVVLQKKAEIKFWRIHRRWADDEHGHELTLDCFTNEEAASEIKSLINNSDYFKILQNRNLLQKFEMVPADTESKTAIINDTGWPEPLKESWLHYINGCCEMFLNLIGVLKKDIKTDINKTSDISEIEKSCIELERKLTEIWKSHGNNAFFHHINAIFGYQQLRIQPQLWARF